MPKSWAPTAAHIERARAKGVDVMAEAEAFRLHAETHDRHAAVWNAAFTTWLMKARPVAGGVEQPVLDFPLPAWCGVLRIGREEFLERRSESGWVAQMEALASKRAVS